MEILEKNLNEDMVYYIKKHTVLSLAWNDDYILEVLCTSTDQRNTTDINLLDNISIAGTTCYSLLEWIQIYDNEVDAWNFKFLHLLLVTLIVAASQDSSKYFWVKSLHTTTKD